MKTRIIFSMAMAMVLGLSGANAATYLVGREQGAEDAWTTYLQSNFTAASLGTINTGVYGGGPDVAMGAGDLIIFYREGDSGQYDDGTEVAQWNNNGANILVLNPWLTRSHRLGWFDNTTIISDLSPVGSETTATVPTDSLFAGTSIGVGNTVDLYTDPLNASDGNLDTQNGLDVGTVLATSGGGVTLARIAQGSAWSGDGQSGSHGGDRIFFAMAEDLDDAAFDSFTADGKTVLNNSLVELGLVAIPEPSTFGLLALSGLGMAFRRRRLA